MNNDTVRRVLIFMNIVIDVARRHKISPLALCMV